MNSKTLGYLYVLIAITIFAGQDAFSKLLGDKYPPIMVTMIRFWAFAVFVVLLAATSPGGLRKAIATKRPVLQVVRGMLLVSEVVVVVISFTIAGLAMTQSIFQATPLMITLLSVPLLGETVGWRRGVALAVGLIGVLIILNPTNVHFDIRLLLPLGAGFMFALYSIATRAVSSTDSAVTSVFYAGVAGAALATLIGPFYWTPIAMEDWPAMAALCICGATSHYFMIKAYSLLSAVEVQPLTYLQLVMGVAVAVAFFGETVSINMAIGAVIVVGAGLFTVWREHRLGIRKDKAEKI
ncbi:drug/metabolite transporter (DMT)-like permease [Neorhizobium huautlense]|uniref:Drug/metabolite transporter (DMT)-like permease n=1 Tax=Neorhizobium huautlense TaxID=67774 RepID=A0ABT9PYJ3_9HYPH|nr:DMT family transporter [Neorhizobium huautlense]MDP9839561.1 drug/metabolite transporter (DMT)-like permease [Neorhizobium huautlense]